MVSLLALTIVVIISCFIVLVITLKDLLQNQ